MVFVPFSPPPFRMIWNLFEPGSKSPAQRVFPLKVAALVSTTSATAVLSLTDEIPNLFVTNWEDIVNAEERYLYTGKGKKDLVKAEERLELDRNLAYNLRHQEELDKMGMEYDIQHNIEHIPSPAQARAEKNRQAADAAEVERINKSNEAIEQLKPYEEMIRRAGTYYTGGERLDK